MSDITSKKEIGAVKRFFLLDRLGNGTKSEAILLWFSIVPFIDYISSAIVFLAVTGAIVFDKQAFRAARSDKAFIIIGCLISGFSMLSSAVAVNFIGMAISFGIICFFIIAGYLKETVTAVAFRKATVVVSMGSIVSLMAALFQKFVIFPDGDLYRPTAGAYNANYFGAIIAMTTIVATVRLIDGEQTEEEHKWYEPTKVFWIFILAVNMASLLICESRSSLLSLTVCVIALMFLKKWYILCGIAILGGGGLWLIGWLYPELFSWTNSLSFIFSERAIIWENAFRSFSQNPYTILMGRGPMTYYMVMEKEGLYVANHAHNLLFDSLINSGIIGTALYAALVIYIAKFSFKKRREGDTDGWILSALLIVQVMVQGIADVTILWYQCASLAAIIMMSKYKKENSEKRLTK